MELLLVLAYTGWATFSGWKFLTGRSAWLDSPEMPNKIVKIALSIVVGWVIGAFYFIYWVLKLFGLFGM